MGDSRSSYSPRFKAQVALEALRGGTQPCSYFSNPSSQWRSRILLASTMGPRCLLIEHIALEQTLTHLPAPQIHHSDPRAFSIWPTAK